VGHISELFDSNLKEVSVPFSDENEEKSRPGSSSPEHLEADRSEKTTSGKAVEGGDAMLQMKKWLATIVIPTPISLGAIVLAAFLLFPAIKGLTSSSRLRQLEQTNSGLQREVAELRSESTRLQRELAEREVRLSQRTHVQHAIEGGIFISPLLSLQPQKARVPDLITIDFSQSDEAILVFSLPNHPLDEIEVDIYQEGNLLWNQSIAIPADRLLNQNLVSFLLTRPRLGPGTYRLRVEGNPTGKRIELNQFDLTING
jgi:hypothetical protein